MMKVVVAIDSFKGSMSSMEAGEAAREGILQAVEAQVEVRPLADGGEGTTRALIQGMGAQEVLVLVDGPMGVKRQAVYGYLPERRLAVMEMAEAAGITHLQELDPWHATTRGVGEMILDAVQKGAEEIIIGIGGSATNDGGVGMLQALGVLFLDEEGKEVPQGAKALSRIAKISTAEVPWAVKACRFHVACDVNNPLCGKNGATYIYGPQKGFKREELEIADRDMGHYARKAAEFTGREEAVKAGAGAAGGLGFSFLTFLDARLEKGIDLIMDVTGLSKELETADFVVTGEGRLDAQTAMGKAPAGVAAQAKKYGAKVLALCGSVGEGAQDCNGAGIDAYFPILRTITTLEEAMDNEKARENIRETTAQIFRLIGAVEKGL